jgi:hypothetical protein
MKWNAMNTKRLKQNLCTVLLLTVLPVLKISAEQSRAAEALVPGKSGQAVNLAADSRIVEVAIPGVLAERPVTFKCRVRFNRFEKYNIVMSVAPKTGKHWEIYTTPASGVISLLIPGVGSFHGQTRLTADAWHDLAFRIDRKGFELYADGKKEIAQTAEQDLVFDEKPLILGGVMGDRSLHCDGAIDELVINRNAEALDGIVPEAPAQPGSSTLAIFHFDEVDGAGTSPNAVSSGPPIRALVKNGQDAAKETIQFGADGQVILPEAAYMLGRMPGIEYAKEPSRPDISQAKDFSDTQQILKGIPSTFQGLPTVAAAPSGRVWVSYWIGGDVEHDRHTKNRMVLYTAASPGAPMEGPVVITKSDHGYYTFQPNLWIDPSGRLWFTWVELGVGEEGLSTVALVTDDPGSAHPKWEFRGVITPGHRMNKPTVLKNGDWICPAEDFTDAARRKNRLYISRDQGKSFSFLSSLRVDGSAFPELMTVEKNDGSLWMLTRTDKGITEATSADMGKTWQDIRPLPGIHTTNTRFHITRLKSGRLLLVFNDHPQYRGNMTAALSEDDGKTWTARLLLDDYGHVTYPDAQQMADGSIVIVYDKARYKIRPGSSEVLPLARWGEIKMARITEEDILAGKLVSPGSFINHVAQKMEKVD